MSEIIGYGNEVAKIFGLKQGERFKLKLTEHAKALGYKPIEDIYAFSADQLMRVGYDDGWSDLYGGDARILEKMICGLYTVEKLKIEKND